jgi:hypothetical protein
VAGLYDNLDSLTLQQLRDRIADFRLEMCVDTVLRTGRMSNESDAQAVVRAIRATRQPPSPPIDPSTVVISHYAVQDSCGGVAIFTSSCFDRDFRRKASSREFASSFCSDCARVKENILRKVKRSAALRDPLADVNINSNGRRLDYDERRGDLPRRARAQAKENKKLNRQLKAADRLRARIERQLKREQVIIVEKEAEIQRLKSQLDALSYVCRLRAVCSPFTSLSPASSSSPPVTI